MTKENTAPNGKVKYILLEASLLRTEFVPKESDSIPLRAAVVSQQKTIAEMDSKVAHIEQRIQDLRIQREVVQNALAVNEAFLAPVRRVAPEILGKIFEHCLPHKLQKTRSRDSPLLLMRVSRRWRSVAQETPRLWTQVLVDSKTPMPYAEMWIENSGSLPLSVALYLEYIGNLPETDSDTDEEVAGAAPWTHGQWAQHSDDAIATFPIPVGNIEVIQMFIEQLARIRRFELHCSYSVLRVIFPTGLRRNMASLEEFTVSCSNFTRWSSLDPNPDVYHVEEARLHTLTIYEYLFTMVSIKPTSNLRVLTLLNRQPMSQLSKFLRLCPGLEDLVIEDASLYTLDAELDAQNLEPDPIVLNNLLELDIGWGKRDEWYRPGAEVAQYGPFLRSLHTPAINSLILKHFLGDMDELYHFFANCASSLRELTLVQLPCNSYQFYRIMKDLTELQTLSLKSFKDSGGIWEPLTPEEHSPPNLWNCPKLHSLECEDCDLGRDFLNFVRRRVAPIPQSGSGSIPHADGFNYITDIAVDIYVPKLHELQLQGRDLTLKSIRHARRHYHDWVSD